MKNFLPFLFLFLAASCAMDNSKQLAKYYPSDIPLPEHPRPDWEREAFLNLNGEWGFASDPQDIGERENWFAAQLDSVFNQAITVPFSWASPLSGIGRANFNFGWYMREIMLPRGGVWKNKHYWLVIGASDFTTTVWVNGKEAGEHTGGYTPFAFDITDFLSGGPTERIVIRVEDLNAPDRPTGNQMYGDAKGIWQTVYLEGRSPEYLEYVHFSPDIDSSRVGVTVKLPKKADEDLIFSVAFEGDSLETFAETLPAGTDSITYTVPIPNQHLWTFNDPFLYNVSVGLDSEKKEFDRVYTYFGMRKISVMNLPDTGEPYIALNNRPVYLKMALDRSYHPVGFYTFPDDAFIQDDIVRAKQLGLNGLRVHVKTEVPRKLYWADRHGLLIMADIPNWWGNPDKDAKKYWTNTAHDQIIRDYNHPSIFSWVLFDETLGISNTNINGIRVYLPQNRDWTKEQYTWAKSLDPTRLVDDNSTSNGDHVATDINSWQASFPARKWAAFMDTVVTNTYPGSTWNFTGGASQSGQPMINSSSGAFDGYVNSTGDIDITYEYHMMMNEFRRRPKIAGFVFNEFHDVINQWNGFYRYNRSIKEFGLDELCPGMTMQDFQSDLYVIPGRDFEQVVAPGTVFTMPMSISIMAAVMPVRLTVKTTLHGWNRFGEHKEYATGEVPLNARSFAVYDLPSMKLTAPSEDCIAIFTTTLLDPNGNVLHRNFVPFQVKSADKSQVITSTAAIRQAGDSTGVPASATIKNIRTRVERPDTKTVVLRQRPSDFSGAEWTIKTRAVLDSMKVWGTGGGYFEYTFPFPQGIRPQDISAINFTAELSSRQVQGKDMTASPAIPASTTTIDSTHIDPGYSPNSYPQTDAYPHPSRLLVTLNDKNTYDVALADDPADHRGLLSWINQPRYDRSSFLFEPGSYGYLIAATFGEEAALEAAKTGSFRIRLTVPDISDSTGGLAVYGEQFGRYPVGPTLVIKRK
jgi:hypothetical protein